jgi:multiple sugar transport system substrate-binding protein
MSLSISRRRLLAYAGGLAATAALAACGGAASPTAAPAKPTEAPKPADKPAAAATTAPAAGAATKPAAAATTAPAAGAATAPAAGAATKPAGATAAPAAQPAASGKPGVEFQVATRGSGDGEVMEKTLGKFQQETGNKGTHVSYGGEPEYWAKVQAQHATKQVADVIWASTGGIYTFANRGVLAELDPIIAGDKYSLEDYVKNALDTLKLNGKLYGLPWGGHAGNGAVSYNVDLLAKGGINVTEDGTSFENVTWDQIMEAGAKIGSADTFTFLPGTDFLGMTNIVGSYGGEFLTPDGKALAIETPEFKKGLQYRADLFKNKVAPVFDPKLNSGELFGTGKLAISHSGYGGQFSPGPKVIGDRFKWGVGLPPKGPAGKRGTALTINGQTIWSGTQKKDTAWQFVKYLMDPAQNVEVVLSGGGRPALRNAVLDNERLMKEMKAHKALVPLIKASEPWKQPANFRWAEFNSTVQQVFADLWLGKQTVDQAIADAKPKFQAILDKPVA